LGWGQARGDVVTIPGGFLTFFGKRELSSSKVVPKICLLIGFDHRVGHFLAPAGRRRPTTPVSSGAEGLVPHREEPGVADAMIKAKLFL
jgi:hypothetical protein